MNAALILLLHRLIITMHVVLSRFTGSANANINLIYQA